MEDYEAQLHRTQALTMHSAVSHCVPALRRSALPIGGACLEDVIRILASHHISSDYRPAEHADAHWLRICSPDVASIVW